MEPTATRVHAVPSHGPAEHCRRSHTTRPYSPPTRPTPMLALSRVLVSTPAHHAVDWSVETNPNKSKFRVSAERSCHCARPRTAATIAPKRVPSTGTSHDESQRTLHFHQAMWQQLQTAATSGGGIRNDQTVERTHSFPAARTLPPTARAKCLSIAATAPGSVPANAKGGTSSCGSTPPDSRNAYPCGKGEPSERQRSGAGDVGVQVYCSITRLHCPCLITSPGRLVLPHIMSSLLILRDRGDISDSQQGIQTMLPSTSATLTVVLTTHLSDGLVKDDHGERHGVATAPPRAHRTRLRRSNKVLNLFACSTYIQEW